MLKHSVTRSISIVTDHGLDDWASVLGSSRKFSSSQHVYLPWGPPSITVSGYRAVFFLPKVKLFSVAVGVSDHSLGLFSSIPAVRMKRRFMYYPVKLETS